MINALPAKRPEWMTAKRVAVTTAIVIGLIGAAALTGGGGRIVSGSINSFTRLLEDRSPGERRNAMLTKKPKEGGLKKKGYLHERVLGKIFPPTPPNSAAPPDGLVAFGALLGPPEIQFPDITLPETEGSVAVPNGGTPIYGPVIASLGSGGGNGGPGAGGGGPGEGGGVGGDIGGGAGETPVVGTLPPLVPEVAAAVPEPASWLLMLLGAALSAGAMRRDRSRRLRTRSAGVNA